MFSVGARTSLSAISPKGDEKVSITFNIQVIETFIRALSLNADRDVRAPTQEKGNKLLRLHI
ncbi:MAG: hypothetical protein M3Q99_08905 [Acidobacteriota bacterium]|nr:hypothetical protein [Acidobacteriota bacterium]